jgi:hypothetical protein
VQGFDSYGGSEDRRFEVTGYSRLELAEDRWWTVDPTGGAFVTVGLNLADESNLKCPHSAAPVRLRGEQGTRVGDRGPAGRTVPALHRLVEEFSKCVYETI